MSHQSKQPSSKIPQTINSEEGVEKREPSPAFIVCRLFDDGHSDSCEVISHCGFDLHFSNNEQY